MKKTLLLLTLSLAACGKEHTPSGPICVNGECTADLYVSCFATNEVKGLKADLSATTASFPVDQGPVALDFADGGLWVAHSLGAPTLVRLAPGVPLSRVTLGGPGDLEGVRVANGFVYASNSGASALTIVDTARNAPIDEVPLKRVGVDAAVFPQGLDLDATGARAYVALYGSASQPSFSAGNEIAVVDVTASRGCAAAPCGRVVKRISFEGVPGAYDAGAFPFPSGVLRIGTRIYVTLSNLGAESTPFGTFYTAPAGSGRLAVIDTAANDAVSIVDLGAGCRNPGALAGEGATVYVSCGSDATGTAGAVVAVTGSNVSPPLSIPVERAGQIAICKGVGYVTDQFSGKVVRFVPGGSVTGSLDVCPLSQTAGFAWASDVECGP